jgi:hypothetical protein
VAGDRHVVQNESLCPLEKIERVAVELAVVEELALLRSSKARHPQETLREIGQQSIRPAEESAWRRACARPHAAAPSSA